MEIKRTLNNAIALFDGERQIETYEFGKEIDFSKLVSFLIESDFNVKLVLGDEIEDKTEQENNLISFVQRIIDDYNTGVDKYVEETKKVESVDQ